MTLRSTLKQWFSRGNKPTAAQFAEWIDSFWHKSEDTIQMSDINMLPQTLNGKSDVGHTHDASEIRNLPSMTVDANIDPASTNPVENRAVSEALNGKANSNHQHGISDVNGLTQALNGKANTDHNHNDLYQPKGEYAPSDHEHSQYATNSAVQDLQEQIDLLAQGGADKKEVIAVSTYSDLTAISEPSQEVIYKTLDTNKLYLYNGRVYEDVTGVSIDNTIYVSDIAGLLTSEQEPGLYSVLVVTTTGNTTTVSATYSFAVTSVTRLLQNKDGWAERVTIGGSYQWSWHLYSYAGHNHDDAYAAKNHSHSQYLTQHQDISGKQDKTDNSLLTTVKTIVGAINELWNKFADYALSNHNHDGVYQPAGSYAAANHNHDGVYQPAGSYAAANHNHDGVYQPAGSYAAADHTHSQYLTQHQDISGKQDKTDNSLLTTAKTIIGAINELWTKFKDYLKGIQHVTHAELVALRDNGELVPGQQYRITDFVTTVANDTEARSAGHPFDIIAVADDATTLNENARAVKHAGDTYFQNSKLSAWKLKYSLDNDTTRWFHADPENGKGVIYFMEDEFGNIGKCDFKNFQYKRYKVTDDSADGILGSLDGQYVGFDEEMKDLIIEDMNDYIWAYAASMPSYTFDDETEELEFDMQNQLDATLNQIPEGAGIDADGGGYAHPVIYCKGNKFTAHQVAVSVDDGEWTYPMRASNIVLFCYPKYFEGDDDIPARIEFENSADNVFAPDCDFITMNGVSARNTFLTAYSNIIFGGSVWRSIFKGQYSCCTFGGHIGYTTFGGYINGATFGGYIWDTTFGGEIYRATFGGDIRNTTFGGEIWNTTFGGDIERATFGGNLHNGHIHGYLYNVSIGSAGETWTNLVIDPGVEYVSVTCTESGDADIKNVHIFGGVSGTYDNPITVSIPTRNNALLEIKPTTKTEILV